MLNGSTTWSEAEALLAGVERKVATVLPEYQLDRLRVEVAALQPFVIEGFLSASAVREQLVAISANLELPVLEVEAIAADLLERTTFGGNADSPPDDDWQPPDYIPDESLINEIARSKRESLDLISPSGWKGTSTPPIQWLALNRVPAADATILSSDGGGGKTTVSLQLAISVERDLGDWLGTTVESGRVLFFSAEEDEAEIRRRYERICRGRDLDPHASTNLFLHFPDLEGSLFAVVTKTGVQMTPLFTSFASTVRQLAPALVVIDAIAAVFGGDHRDRAQVRAFVSAFRKLARQTGAAIVLLDHPSLSGMSDGSGRSGSVDWSNVVRSRLYMRMLDDDNDARELEVKKANRGPRGEKIVLRWVDGAFVVEGSAAPLERQAAEAKIDDLFLRLLEKRNAQGRGVGPKPGRNFAPAEFAKDPEANGVKPKAFEASMERLFHAGKIINVTSGPKSKQVTRIERSSGSSDA